MISDLNTVTDTFNWTAYLEAQGVPAQKDLIINQPSFVTGFGETFAATSLADLANLFNFPYA